jgi:hypothetical protein
MIIAEVRLLYSGTSPKVSIPTAEKAIICRKNKAKNVPMSWLILMKI